MHVYLDLIDNVVNQQFTEQDLDLGQVISGSKKLEKCVEITRGVHKHESEVHAARIQRAC
jgi:hypothetical protein